jgi:hypothetical protein
MWDFIKSKINFNWKTFLKTLKDAVLVAALNAIALAVLSSMPPELADVIQPKLQEGMNLLYGFLGISAIANLTELRKKPV